jgi:hypothetical protein
LKGVETKTETQQLFYKKSFFTNFMQYKIISPKMCECKFYLFVSSRKPSFTSKSMNDHYLFCPIHQCFVNFHLLHGCHSQVFKTIINPLNPVFFDTKTIFGNFQNLFGTLVVYDSHNENLVWNFCIIAYNKNDCHPFKPWSPFNWDKSMWMFCFVWFFIVSVGFSG